MPITIKQGLMKYKNGQNEYIGINTVGETSSAQQIANINQAGATQVAAVNTAGSTQVSAVNTKGQEVLASIPSDYTALGDEVTDLKSALENAEDAIIEDKKQTAVNMELDYSSGAINSSGGVTTNASYDVSKIIPVGNYKRFVINYDLQSSVSTVNAVGFFLDAQFGEGHFVGVIQSVEKGVIYDIPANTVNIRFTYPSGNPKTITFISSKVSEIETNLIKVEDNFDEAFDLKPYDRQLYDKSNAQVFNGYFNGVKYISSSAHRITYIPCQPNTTYTVSGDSTLWVSNGIGQSPDAPANNGEESIPSAITTTESGRKYYTFTTSATAGYISILYYNTNVTQAGTEAQVLATIMVAIGTDRTQYYSYEDYYQIKPSALPDLSGLLVNYNPVVKKTDDSITTGESIEFNVGNIKKNNVIGFSATFDSFGTLTIGQGKTALNQTAYITINDSTVKVYRYTTEPVEWISLNHGLTIADYIDVTIEVSNDEIGWAKLSITSNQETYTYARMAWMGCGAAVYATSVNGTYNNCVLTHYCADYDADVWMCGDSYFDHWVTHVLSDGYKAFLCDGYSGRKSDAALVSLNRLLLRGKPKSVVWCIGMNDGDTGAAVNATWNTVYSTLKSLCEEKNIRLILCTIPNVPSVDNSYKNAIIRASGYDYIDLAKAVGSDISTSWYTGLLSTDNVHPSVEGDKVIAKFMEASIPQTYGT